LHQYGSQISETITTSTTVVSGGVTTQDFIKVTAVSVSCAFSNSSGGGIIGTNTQGGTPWQVVDTTRNPISLEFNIDVTSPTTVAIVSFEYSMDYPTYDQNTRLWGGAAPTAGPRPTISSLGSSVTLDTIGNINFPIAAWRLTLTSTSSAAGSVAATILQSG